MQLQENADWMLVEMARNGNEHALEELLNRYRPLIISIQERYYLKGLELSEWAQESMIVLWEVVKRFDTSRQEAFGSYFKTALLNCRRDIVRRINAQKRKATGPLTSIDANPSYFAETLKDEDLFSSEHLVVHQQRLMEIIKKHLSKMERTILLAQMAGDSDEEILERLHLTPVQFHNAYERMKRKTRELIWEE
ncbi:sigma-70 family RNA polymerase sigma factor [Secundilactobacillus folii]|uniref:Sigma-70 family RNA polymerase sigma factor n=1 Tax=Secundilactobacillus folii TaxID=2678357 RepID=A0A7X3C225_9LACO|nr:sigma-70 family RNA polymerase sigma factor [Secundilactobacillus folii]MTV82380.1 sigma-70 family RNA polymerase sigma factor [Secundilactobacillus folii]